MSSLTRFKLWCRCEFSCWIAADLIWKSIKPLDDFENREHQITQIGTAAKSSKSFHLIGHLCLEITLAKRLPERVRNSLLSKSTMINELGLADDAFLPKLYTIRIEKGNFIEPSCVGFSDSWQSRFALRLIFDKSPYPPRSEWKKPEGGPDSGQFWDHVEFVGRTDPELKKRGRAMNDNSSAMWDTCLAS